jgi:hypothetical protein
MASGLTPNSVIQEDSSLVNVTLSRVTVHQSKLHLSLRTMRPLALIQINPPQSPHPSGSPLTGEMSKD